MSDQQCECVFWCRDGNDPHGLVPDIRGKHNLPLVTTHHKYCKHYMDSVIDVWKVQYGEQFYYTEHEPTAEEMENGEIVTKTKMHKEVFEQLPEFEGF